MKKIIFLLTILFISCETQKLEIIDLFNAENDPNVSCYRIPSIITAVNGDLIAMIDERVPSCGDLKWSRDINIVMRKSFDNGKTWTDIETVVDYPLGQSASDPSMILDEKINTIFMFYNYMDLDNEKDIYYLRYKKSVNNGKSWSESIDITDQISKSGWEKDFKFITSGRGIQTQDGTLLHCLVNLQKGTHVFGSNDNGNSWFITETPTSPGDESKIIELNDGRWMVNSRVNNLGYRYSHISNDNGKSWISKKEENIIRRVAKDGKLIFWVGGSLSYIIYIIVFWGFTQAPIPMVAALRETSIFFSIFIGYFFLSEKITPAKILSILLILAGVIGLKLF